MTKPESFFTELQQRNVIRVAAAYLVAAWLIVQIVDTLAPAFRFDDAAVRTAAIVLAIGLVPVVILAWVFELTPTGLKLEKDVDRSKSITAQTGGKLDRVIIVMLVTAVSYFAFDKFVLDPARDSSEIEAASEQARSEALLESYGDKSIAVLPFADLSPAGDQEYFSDGMSEELINLLAKIPELRVISRSSAFSFKDKSLELPEIAERLNVAHMLEGSVRKAGNRIRVSAQLIEARTDTHIWSANFDRELEDIFSIQDEIAAEVVGRLRVTLLDDGPNAEQTDTKAHDLYLQARYLINQGNTDLGPNIELLLKDALNVDADFVPALNQLAEVYAGYGLSGRWPMAEASVRVRELVDHALSIDPDNGFAHVLRGFPDGVAVGNIIVVARTLKHGLALDPSNLDSVRVAAEVSYSLGRLDQAIMLMNHVLARDPLCTACLYRRALTYRAAGRYDDAEAAVKKFRILSSGGQHTLGTILLLKGDAQVALKEFDELEEPTALRQVKLHGRAMALHDLGRQAESETAFAELRADYSDSEQLLIAEVYAWMGKKDEAFVWLNKAFERNPLDVVQVFLVPLYKNLHDDPRWHAFLEKTRTSPEQLAAFDFDIQLPR